MHRNAFDKVDFNITRNSGSVGVVAYQHYPGCKGRPAI